MIGGRRYIDGGVHSHSNLDLLLDAELDAVIALNPMSSGAWVAGGGVRERLAGARRRYSGALLAGEVAALRARGTNVLVLEPAFADLAAMGPNMMARDRLAAVIEAGRSQHRARAAAARAQATALGRAGGRLAAGREPARRSDGYRREHVARDERRPLDVACVGVLERRVALAAAQRHEEQQRRGERGEVLGVVARPRPGRLGGDLAAAAAASGVRDKRGSSATGSPAAQRLSGAPTRRAAAAISAVAARTAASTRSSESRSTPRTSSPRSTRPGITLTAPGATSSVPTVATVSAWLLARDPLDREDDLRGGGERVAAGLHRHLAGVAGLAASARSASGAAPRRARRRRARRARGAARRGSRRARAARESGGSSGAGSPDKRAEVAARALAALDSGRVEHLRRARPRSSVPASRREPIVPAPKRGASSAAQTSSAGRAPRAPCPRASSCGELEREHGAERAVVAAAVGDGVDVRARGHERAVPVRAAAPRGCRGDRAPARGPARAAQPATSRIAVGLGGARTPAGRRRRRARARSPTAPPGARRSAAPSGKRVLGERLAEHRLDLRVDARLLDAVAERDVGLRDVQHGDLVAGCDVGDRDDPPGLAIESVASTSGNVARRSPPDSAVRYSLTKPSSRSPTTTADVERVLGAQLLRAHRAAREDRCRRRCVGGGVDHRLRAARLRGEQRLAERRARS